MAIISCYCSLPDSAPRTANASRCHGDDDADREMNATEVIKLVRNVSDVTDTNDYNVGLDSHLGESRDMSGWTMGESNDLICIPLSFSFLLIPFLRCLFPTSLHSSSSLLPPPPVPASLPPAGRRTDREACMQVASLRPLTFLLPSTTPSLYTLFA